MSKISEITHSKLKLLALTSLILLIALSGCNSLLGEDDTEPQSFERLDPADWPTPEPSPSPTITPVIVSLNLTPAQRSEPAPVSPTPVEGTPTRSVTTTVVPSPTPSPAAAQQTLPRSAGGAANLRPVGAAAVSTSQTGLQRGPGAETGSVAQLGRGELIGIYGRDESGRWLFGQTVDEALGWVAYADVYALNTLDDAPLLSPGILAGAAPRSVDLAALTADLSPVTTGRVTPSALNVRAGPGVDFDRQSLVYGDETVEILAVNADQSWALVRTPENQPGWVSLPFIDVAGSLAQAPQISPDSTNPELPPASGSTAGEASPGTQSTRAVLTGSPGVEPARPEPAGLYSGPSLPENTLSEKRAARLNRNIEVRLGPDPSYGVVEEASEGETVSVRATNDAGSWAVIRTPDSGAVGWIPMAALDLEAPLPESGGVTTGRIESNELYLRSGPGIIYGQIASLSIDNTVSVLALSEDQAWALVENLGGVQGWLPLNFVKVYGPLAEIPQVQSPPVPASGQAEALPPVEAQPPQRTGQLVIQTVSGGAIMIIDADGSNLRRLTHGIDPVLSPDGSRVAFTRWVGDIGELWLINADGSNERQILGQMRKAKGPAWSPDGTQIVLNYQQGGRPQEKRTCRDLGSNIPRGAYNIEVSIDPGQDPKICFSLAPDPFWQLRVIDPRTLDYENYDGGTYAFRPTWDRNQPGRIVSDGGRGLAATDLSAKNSHPITDQVNDGSPVFSPDGRHLAVNFGRPGGSKGFNIHRLNSDGSGRLPLTKTPFWIPLQPETSGRQWNNVAPTWSPDGSEIAFVTDRTDRWEIWVMNRDGSNQRPLFSDEINDQLELEYNFVDERLISWQ